MGNEGIEGVGGEEGPRDGNLLSGFTAPKMDAERKRAGLTEKVSEAGVLESGEVGLFLLGEVAGAQGLRVRRSFGRKRGGKTGEEGS